jgi:hypothetical protein
MALTAEVYDLILLEVFEIPFVIPVKARSQKVFPKHWILAESLRE